MRISKKSEYALRALIDIALRQTQGRDLSQIPEMAQRTQIPEKFLEQILLNLKNAGILKSKRGVDGGYGLARSADKIPLGEVVRLMDGPLAPVGCVSETTCEPCSCPDPETCGLRLVMRQVRDALSSVLDQYTLAQVAAETAQMRFHSSKALQFEI